MKTNRKKIVSIGLVLMLVLLGLAALAPTSSAGITGDVPMKPFKIDTVTWDSDGQQFVVELSLKFGLATAGEHAGFKISTILMITTGYKAYTLELKGCKVDKPEDAVKDDEGFAQIEPQDVKWDRDGGTYEGTALVSATLKLLNRGGRPVSSVELVDIPLKITAKGEQPPAPEPDDDGNGK